MCKLSLNVVPNVYNNMHSSFLSLAWHWSGRSLPKGNQWEWWNPGQGPLPGLGDVGHSPRGTSGSAGTLDWGLKCLDSQSTCHPSMPPDTPTSPACPQCLLTPYWPQHSLMPLQPCQPPDSSRHSLHPCHPNAPEHPTPPLSLLTPLHFPLAPDTPIPQNNHIWWLWTVVLIWEWKYNNIVKFIHL